MLLLKCREMNMTNHCNKYKQFKYYKELLFLFVFFTDFKTPFNHSLISLHAHPKLPELDVLPQPEDLKLIIDHLLIRLIIVIAQG